MKYLYILFFILVARDQAFTQTTSEYDKTGPYSAGYINIICTDSGRVYKPGTRPGDKFYYRPVEIDTWYPAVRQNSNSSIRYGEMIDLLEQRSNRFQDDTVYKNMTAELVQFISVNLKINDTSKLMRLKTASFLNAESVHDRFPLIIYMSSYNGMSYENVPLFEWLAGHGYVVACITSVGRYPGDMTMQTPDLMEQVNDGSFAVHLLKQRSNVDPGKIGAMGYSWGGPAALLMAIKIQDIKAVLSLDGSEMHYYGESGREDRQFDGLRASPFFQINKINFPYSYLESGDKQNDRTVDSIFNIMPLLTGEKNYVHFPKATHEDFSCLPSLKIKVYEDGNTTSDLYGLFKRFSLDYFNYYLKSQTISPAQDIAMIYENKMGDSIYPQVSKVKKKEFIISGKVIDMQHSEGLAYVNIGIPAGKSGTVSRADGSFLINLDPESRTESLMFSIIGYESQILAVADLLQRPLPVVIILKEKASELKEVVITKKTSPIKTLGNRTTSKFISIGLPLKFLGTELGVKINLGKKPVLLKSFNFNISDARMDSALFRMNIYQFDHGVPSRNILRKNIYIPVGKRPGRQHFDLSDYKLVMNGDILLSLEWIEGSHSGEGTGIMFLSAGFLNSATWHRLTSQAAWKKASGLGVGFNLEVQ